MSLPDLVMCPVRAKVALPAALLCLSMIGGLPGGALAQGPGDLREFLMRLSVGGRRAAYEGRKVIIDFSREVPAITHLRVTHRLPGMERREYVEGGRVVVTRDGWVWQYDPRREVVVKESATADDGEDLPQQENLEQVLRNYRVHLSPGMPIVGRPSTLVQFEPLERGSRPSRRFWVDAEKGLPLRGEVYGADGTLSLLSHFELINYREDFDDKLFRLDAPRARVVESSRNRGGSCLADPGDTPGDDLVWRPASLPGGYELKCRRRSEGNRGVEYQQVFSDGLSTLSLFQSPGELLKRHRGGRATPVTVGSMPGMLHDYGLLKLVTWSGQGRHFALVGELSPERMMDVARSVERPATRKTRQP